jgi:manganese/zinc/iron transport system ATP- binding protein
MSTIVHPTPPEPGRLGDRPEHSAESPLSVHAMTVAYHRKPVLWDVDYDAPRTG